MDQNLNRENLLERLQNLVLDENGIWCAEKHRNIAYPEEGNEFSFKIEDQSYWFQHRNKCILAALSHFPPSGTIVDIGGGNGFVAIAMQNSGQDVILLEPGLQGAIHARNRGIRQVVCSTLEDANFPDRSVPAIGIFDVIEHIENDEAFLRLMHHILAPEGRIYITTPAYQWLWSAEDDFAQHYRRFTN